MSGLIATPEQLGHGVERAFSWTGVLSGREAVYHAIGKLLSLDHVTSQRLALLCLGYACIFLVEGVGLLREKRWAEWLTVAVTATFIPFEIYELVEHVSRGKIVALTLNAAIVAYLLWRRIDEHRSFTGRIRRIVQTA